MSAPLWRAIQTHLCHLCPAQRVTSAAVHHCMALVQLLHVYPATRRAHRWRKHISCLPELGTHATADMWINPVCEKCICPRRCDDTLQACLLIQVLVVQAGICPLWEVHGAGCKLGRKSVVESLRGNMSRAVCAGFRPAEYSPRNHR